MFTWGVTGVKQDRGMGSGGAAGGSSSAGAAASSSGGSVREGLLQALGAAGLSGEAAVVFADAALVTGAVSQGRPVGGLELGFVGPPARAGREVVQVRQVQQQAG